MRDERIWVFATEGIKGATFETSVWDSPVIPSWEHRYHKNQKPLALIMRLLNWIACESVVDPFMGSGTTLVAAKLHGCDAIGIEIEERYCKIAAKRLAQEVFHFKDE
jgi:site-specific DNA-methyltransferase (adenine-specific)